MSGKRTNPDSELFREAVRDVKPIAQRERAPLSGRKPPPRAKFTAADRALVLVESLAGSGADEIADTGDEISFRRDGVQDGVMARLIPLGRDDSPRRPGLLKGKLRIAEDFDRSLEASGPL